MRLIDVRTTFSESKIAFKEIQELNATKYLIVSHAWGWSNQTNNWGNPQEEIDFEVASMPFTEINRLTSLNKIKSACRLAASRKIDYVWIDTCCIDQKNSTEVTEGINSMFEWYHKSELCAVYLADLHYENKDGPNELYERLKACRWFERGWTLQELLAPTQVYFYDKNWTFIGTKKDLAVNIESITGIDRESVENPSSISLRSIAHKMAWASNRKTTKPEDRAYSLIGIFNVNIPMIYGEGVVRAFHRLQKEITMTTSELSVFGWEDERNREFYSMLADSPDVFASGRDLNGYIPEQHYNMTNKGIHMTYSLRKVPRKQGNRCYFQWLLPIGYRSSTESSDPDVIGILLRKIDTQAFVRYNGNSLVRYTEQEFRKFPRTQSQTFYVALSPDDYHWRVRQASLHAIFVPQSTTIEVFRVAPEATWDCERGLFFNHPHDDFVTGVSLRILLSDLPKDEKRRLKVNVLFDRRKTPPACYIINQASFLSTLFHTGGRMRWDEIEDREEHHD
ncbi:heterokaryon incompatibility protein-domain-containing protein [Xylariaceae sp. AK1471]|nr:heterokaryon incompatibility protein-domain-containing protein [Xylariaceae sp. AK1471]